MTASRLQEAALARFAQQGFDATSLAEIAADVGIKKPSIYAHFRNKDELYLSLIPLMVAAELDYARLVLEGPGEAVDDAPARILAYLQSIETRHAASFHVQFWMRAMYTPPAHLYEQVMAPMHEFMDAMESILQGVVAASPRLLANAHGLDAQVLVKTCMGMVDSLQVELIYGGAAKYRSRLAALWAVFEAATAPGAQSGGH